MNTKDFLSLLNGHQDKALLFEFAPNSLVAPNYHITEIKHTSIDSVDCGANTDNWKETVIQLWESPKDLGKTNYMSVYKAMGILNKVGKIKPYNDNAEVKIEYGNAYFHTAQLYINDFKIIENQLVFILGVKKTECKAEETCGIGLPLEKEDISCTPGSGCC